MNKFSKIANQIRYKVCEMSHEANAAHLGSSLSCIDILVSIFFGKIFKFNKNKIESDKFILSKGHAAAALYSILAKKNYFTENKLKIYGKNNSYYEEHPNIKVKGVISSTGSLGHGLSFGAGISLGEKIRRKNFKTIVLMSDGECNEGSVWEAAGFASAQNLKNLIVIIDYNKWQATGRTKSIVGGNLIKKWNSFGWKTFEIKGHNIIKILQTLKKAKKSHKPVAIIANTIKGKGIKFMEDDNNWHYRVPTKNELIDIKSILKIKN